MLNFLENLLRNPGVNGKRSGSDREVGVEGRPSPVPDAHASSTMPRAARGWAAAPPALRRGGGRRCRRRQVHQVLDSTSLTSAPSELEEVEDSDAVCAYPPLPRRVAPSAALGAAALLRVRTKRAGRRQITGDRRHNGCRCGSIAHSGCRWMHLRLCRCPRRGLRAACRPLADSRRRL